ncbi:HTH domain-containing protein [Rhodobacterales bacterium]|nr:HTH domain-containing protein [Rhodobacterales bacterium]
MDSLITAAARALSSGDPLSALKHIALREDPPALALRGIAMAQLGDLPKARDLLRRAGRAFGAREPMARARCGVAEAEIALVSRDLGKPMEGLVAARETLEKLGDRANAAHADYLEARRLLLIGRLDEAERGLRRIDVDMLPKPSLTGYHLVEAGVAMRRIRSVPAREALRKALEAARMTGIPALIAEAERAADRFAATVARLVGHEIDRALVLEEIEELFNSDALVIDACRNVVRAGEAAAPLASRPVLFALVRALAEAWPEDTSRETLLARAFRARQADDSHRARLRVEIGRLREAIGPLAEVSATERGFRLEPPQGRVVSVLAPPVEGDHGNVLALLADGEAWSTSALALALGVSARTVQRALEELSRDGKVESFGRGRACRWIAASVPGFPSNLLLPASGPAS